MVKCLTNFLFIVNCARSNPIDSEEVQDQVKSISKSQEENNNELVEATNDYLIALLKELIKNPSYSSLNEDNVEIKNINNDNLNDNVNNNVNNKLVKLKSKRSSMQANRSEF